MPSLKLIRLSVFISATTLLLACLVGYCYLTGGVTESVSGESEYVGMQFSSVFFELAQINLPTVISLFSGVITAGTTTILSLVGLGLFVGATFHVGVDTIGLRELWCNVGNYFPLEILSCVLAASGGLLPVVSATRNWRNGNTRLDVARSYLGGARVGALLLIIAIVLMILSLLIETHMIVSIS